MTKTTLILIFGAVAIGLIYVFSANKTVLAGTAAPGTVTGITPGSASVQPAAVVASSSNIIAGIFSLFTPSGNANTQAAASVSALASVQSGGGSGAADSSLAAALNQPLQQPIQQLTASEIASEYGGEANPPSIVTGYDDDSDSLLTPVPYTGSALDSPGLPGDVVSSD